MQQKQGLFLVIEGIDGSGKGTQFELLAKRLIEEGYDTATFDFPRYQEPSSYFVKEYLNGKYGTADEVGPYTGSLFFALDRFAAASAIKEALNQGKVVLANRYTGSNMAHQGTKFSAADQRRNYFLWLENLEFQMLGVPRPDKNIILRVSAETAQYYIDQKKKRSYTDKKRDLHEADLGHLRRAVEVYDDLGVLFPDDFRAIDCERDGKLLELDSIHELIWNNIRPLLPPKSSRPKPLNSMPEKTSNPYVQRTDTGYKITPAGEEYLKEAVTNGTDNVYAFTDKLSPLPSLRLWLD